MALNRLGAAAVVAVWLLGSLSIQAEPKNRHGFSHASLAGTYAVEDKGDGSVSAGLGLAFYDGAGNSMRRILVNAPDPQGGRRTLIFESRGDYVVNPDGIGSATYANFIDGQPAGTVQYDFVITAVASGWPLSRGASKIGAALSAAQRGSGVTVSLITSEQLRISEDDLVELE